jgi:phosphotriesterase-related protein
MRVLDILEEEGASLKKVYMSHLDSNRSRSEPFGLDVEYIASIAERGAYVSLDGFGTWEWPVGMDCYNIIFPTDFERAVAIKQLISMGFLDQILLSHDVCMKHNLRSYGGRGYDHLVVNVPHLLKRYGIPQEHVTKMLEDNPRKLVST